MYILQIDIQCYIYIHICICMYLYTHIYMASSLNPQAKLPRVAGHLLVCRSPQIQCRSDGLFPPNVKPPIRDWKWSEDHENLGAPFRPIQFHSTRNQHGSLFPPWTDGQQVLSHRFPAMVSSSLAWGHPRTNYGEIIIKILGIGNQL